MIWSPKRVAEGTMFHLEAVRMDSGDNYRHVWKRFLRGLFRFSVIPLLETYRGAPYLPPADSRPRVSSRCFGAMTETNFRTLG
jgi:hypothetical protein